MLVNKSWKILIFPGRNHQNGGFSMAMLVYRSVVSVESIFVTRWHLDWSHLKKNIDFTRGLIWSCKGTTSFLKIYSGLEIFSTEFLARLKMQWFFSTKLWNCWKISAVFFFKLNFWILLGEMIQFDEHISLGWNHQLEIVFQFSWESKTKQSGWSLGWSM